MTLDVVNTSDGAMRVAGLFGPSVAISTDLLMCLLLFGPFVHHTGVTDAPTALIWLCGIAGYSLLAFRGVIPSLGRWTLGLRGYSYNQVEEYEGKGVLYVYEDLSSRTYTFRAIATVLVLGALFGIGLVITRALPGGPA